MPGRRGAKLVQFNLEYFNAAGRQALDNLYSYAGVWVTIAGGIIGSAGPFLVGLMWDIHP